MVIVRESEAEWRKARDHEGRVRIRDLPAISHIIQWTRIHKVEDAGEGNLR